MEEYDDDQDVTDDCRLTNMSMAVNFVDRGGDGDFMFMASKRRNPPANTGNPKKKTKWRWRWKQKDIITPEVAPFSHNPPGHTCGLPCCSNDNETQQVAPPTSQRGCVPVPILSQVELSESNFVMKRKTFQTASERYATEKNRSDTHKMNLASVDSQGTDENSSRAFKFTTSKDNTPSAEMIGLPGADAINEMTNWLPHRKYQTLSPWEHVTGRHITLPDCPQAQYSIMFLNHQPGETSDFSEADNRKTINNSGSKTSAFKGISQVQISGSTETDHSSTDKSINSKSETGSIRQTKRLVHSKLPDVPTEDKDSALDNVVSIDEDDTEESSSGLEDHVYDVLCEVKENAEKISQNSAPVNPELVSDATLGRTQSDLTLSDLEMFFDKTSVNGSVTDSYIYNGSLLSQGTSDTDPSPYYPGLISRHRYLMDGSDTQDFLPQNRYYIYDDKHFGRDSLDDQKLDTQNTTSGSKLKVPGSDLNPGESDTQSYQSKSETDYDVQKFNIRVDEFDMNHQRSLAPFEDKPRLSVDLDSTTKLKLWDLKLITLNREGNHYSTFPLKTLSDNNISIGDFPRTSNMGFQYNNSIHTNHYADQSLDRIIQGPGLPNYAGKDQVSVNFLESRNVNPFRVGLHGDPPDGWKQFFVDKQRDWEIKSDLGHDHVSRSTNQILENWTRTLEDGLVKEPITFSGIYKWIDQNNEDINNIRGLSAKEDDSNLNQHCLSPNTQHVASPLVRTENYLSPTDQSGLKTSSYSGSFFCGSDTYPSSSNYSGSMSSRAFDSSSSGSKCTEMLNNNGLDMSVKSGEVYMKDKILDNTRGKDETILCRNGSLIDWRRQADLYRHNNFITLIL